MLNIWYRHIKQAGLALASTILSVKLFASQVSRAQRAIMCVAVAAGLEDNWTQVRYSASQAARSLLLSVPENERIETLLKTLLPRICMNRFYVADGVRNLTQEIWALVMLDRGREYIEMTITEVVDYYVVSTLGPNHMVIEAALAAIAELTAKINIVCVRPYAIQLFQASLTCLRSESWPVRDAACLSTASVVRHHPIVLSYLGDDDNTCIDRLLDIFFVHLQDSIW